MKYIRYGLVSIVALVVLVALAFVLELGGLKWKAFFKPKHQSVEREVFENTKSYVHGVAQDLGKYYEEYQKGDEEEKATIQNVIKVRFAEFDADNLQNRHLRDFLIKMRGH